jgi:SAM-dependent methyltransferase
MAVKSEIVSFIENATRQMSPGRSILDVGCGSRAYERLFTGHQYTGIDVAESGRESKKPDLFFDGKNIPLSNSTVDMVLSTEVFEHVEDLDHLIKDIHRVLKPQGSLLVTVPFMWGEHEMPYDFRRFTSVGLRDYLKRNGFEIVSQEQGTVGLAAFLNLGLSEINHSFGRSPVQRLKRTLATAGLKSLGFFFRIIGVKMKRIYIRNIILARKST